MSRRMGRAAPWLGGLTALFLLLGALCLTLSARIGSYVAPDGTLVEPFFLGPLFWLCAAGALVSGGLFAAALLARRRPEKVLLRWSRLLCLCSAVGWAGLILIELLLEDRLGCGLTPLAFFCGLGTVTGGTLWLITGLYHLFHK